MYTKSTLLALMASGLVAAIPVPHEPLSLITTLSTELPLKTPAIGVPEYSPTSSEITATVTVPGHQQNTANAAAPTSLDGLGAPSDPSIAHPTNPHALVPGPDVAALTHVEAPYPDSLLPTHLEAPHPTEVNVQPDASVSSTDIYTSTQVRQEIVVSTPAPQVATPTHPGSEGGVSVPAVKKPEVPTITDPSVPSDTGAPSVEHSGIKKPGTDAPTIDIPELKPTNIPSVEHLEISKPSATVEHPETETTEAPKVPDTGFPSLEHLEVVKPNVESLPVEYPDVVNPITSAPSLEHPEVKPTDISVPSGSEAPKPSKIDIPSPTLSAEVQKPSADAPSVEHHEIEPTGVSPGVSIPTDTDVERPDDGNEHKSGLPSDFLSGLDINNLGGGDQGGDEHEHEHENLPSVSHPSAPEVTRTQDQEHKVPEVSSSVPSSTSTSAPEFQNIHRPTGTPEVDGLKGKTEGDSSDPNTADISLLKTDDTSEPSTGDISLPGTDGIKGKGQGKGRKDKDVKGRVSGEYEVDDDGDWDFEHNYGPWGAEAEGGRDGVKTEAEHDDDD